MKRIIIIQFLLLLYCNSYSQGFHHTIKIEKEFPKIKMEKITENTGMPDCGGAWMETLPLDVDDPDSYAKLLFYICNMEKVVFTPLVEDTIYAVCEYLLDYFSTDSLDYFTVKEIEYYYPYPKKTPFNLSDEELVELTTLPLRNANCYYGIFKNLSLYEQEKLDHLELSLELKDFLSKHHTYIDGYWSIYLIPQKDNE